jgi:hypothetical protein
MFSPVARPKVSTQLFFKIDLYDFSRFCYTTRYAIDINLPDKRLIERYHFFVKAHMQHASSIATGVTVPAGVEKSFAVTQATWRFLANERITPAALAEPLRDFAKQQLGDDPYVLSVFDWSKIDYKKHSAKKDITQISNKQDIGYELTTQLFVSAEHGRPIAPVQMHLKTADGLLSTLAIPPTDKEPHLDQIAPLMRATAAMNLSQTTIHMIDREADSVFHYRQWHAEGFKFLIRANDRIVRWQGNLMKCSEVEAYLDFVQSRNVSIKGKPGIQYVAETEIVLDRPAKRNHSVPIPGEALTLRLVIARVVDPVSGEVLSTWYLLTNTPSDVSAERIALWYYWRWEIESYFKLMKSGGQQLEHWQQESGLAVLKRLLVASMACAVVWSLQTSDDEESEAFKAVLVRLSGKRVKRGCPPTPGVLLAGLNVLLQLFDFLMHIDFDLEKITKLKATFGKMMPGLMKSG